MSGRQRPCEETAGHHGVEDYEREWENLEAASTPSKSGSNRKRRAGSGRRSSKGEAGAVTEGLVVSRSRGSYRVKTRAGEFQCSLRGRLRGHEAPIVGDCVRIKTDASGSDGTLEAIQPRRNTLTRVSEAGSSTARTIAANIDLLVIVLASEPFPPRWVLADRLLALAEREGFGAGLVVNKMDLVSSGSPEESQIAEAVTVYRGLGIPVYYTSATERTGLGEFSEALKEQTSVLSGHSGVGKSSLLNALLPEARLVVKEVNPHTHKGRHTTTLARLMGLPFGGYIVDTPGFREFGLGDMPPADLSRCYPEFRPVIGKCRFPDCLHRQEPGCALVDAVEEGVVSRFRYQNYLLILAGLVEKHRR